MSVWKYSEYFEVCFLTGLQDYVGRWFYVMKTP